MYAVKIESFLETIVTNTGAERGFGSLFGWDLPEDTIFYDEIFNTETITSLAKSFINFPSFEFYFYLQTLSSKKSIIEIKFIISLTVFT